MKYNFLMPAEAQRARDYLEQLIERHATADVKKVSPKRSLNQNSYLHLLLNAFGSHFGYTLIESKEIYKEINANLYTYEKRGRTFMKSSSELTKEEMARSIDRFRERSAEAGYPLPPADNPEWIREIQNAIEQTERYL